MELKEILENVKNGSMDVDQAEKELKDLPFENLGYARLDHHRALRSGFGEVIYCAGKSTDHLVSIYQHFAQHEANVLGTRASGEQYEAVKAVLPDIQYDPVSHILKLQRKKRHRRQSFSAAAQSAFMMSESREFTGSLPVCRKFAVPMRSYP